MLEQRWLGVGLKLARGFIVSNSPLAHSHSQGIHSVVSVLTVILLTIYIRTYIVCGPVL